MDWNVSMRSAAALGLGLTAGCGGAPSTPIAPEAPAAMSVPAPQASAATLPGASAPAPASEVAAGPVSASDPAAVLARVAKDFAKCVADERAATPELSEGRVVLDAAIEGGRATCVVPSEANGLPRKTQECFAARLAKEEFAPGASTLTLPVALKGDALTLAPPPHAPTLDNVEAEGVPAAGAVFMKLTPLLRECVRKGLDEGPHMAGVLHVGARVSERGQVTCALATRGTQIPDSVRACVVAKTKAARFAAPKWGAATVSMPLKIVPVR